MSQFLAFRIVGVHVKMKEFQDLEKRMPMTISGSKIKKLEFHTCRQEQEHSYEDKDVKPDSTASRQRDNERLM
jgi:hypothetical protein